jgi:hypothetical protein
VTYEAIVARVQTREFPGADRLQLGTAAGYQVIVGKDTQDGELGVVFPEGGKLHHEFCMENALYRKHPETGEAMGGYLDESARIRALKMRGQVSEALWMPMQAIYNFLGRGPEEGETIGEPLCEKYYTPATLRALKAGGAQSKKARANDALPRHYDTPQLRSLGALPLCDVAIITEKVHGTSGRTGLVEVEQPKSWWRRLFRINAKKRWEYVTGTRNCVITDGASGEKGQEYRRLVHDRIVEAHEFNRGEIWYYEIAGYDTNGKPIMGPHSVGYLGDPKLEKQLRAEYGERIVYDYGCEVGKHRVFVYRITQDGRDLPFFEVQRRVNAAGMETPIVLALDEPVYSADHLRHLADQHTRGDSVYSKKHPREGVCVRLEDSATGIVHKALKHKGFVFCALEGIARNDANFVDQEEVA